MTRSYAVAVKGDLARGVRLAVNYSGDSDSTGAIRYKTQRTGPLYCTPDIRLNLF